MVCSDEFLDGVVSGSPNNSICSSNVSRQGNSLFQISVNVDSACMSYCGSNLDEGGGSRSNNRGGCLVVSDEIGVADGFLVGIG